MIEADANVAQQLVNVTKTLKLNKDARVDDFAIWALQHKAIAIKEKFGKIMLDSEAKPTDADTIEEHDKRNDFGFSRLLLSMTSQNDIKFVASATITEYPDGCVKTAWAKLMKN